MKDIERSPYVSLLFEKCHAILYSPPMSNNKKASKDDSSFPFPQQFVYKQINKKRYEKRCKNRQLLHSKRKALGRVK